MRLGLWVLLVGASCGGSTTSDAIVIDSVTPAFGPLSGGTRIVITGSGFLRDGATPDRVLFGTHESPQAGVVNDTTLEAELPAGDMSGDVQITVFNQNGNVTAMGMFHYSSTPTIMSISPKSVVYSSDNTTVTVTGSGFKDEAAGVVSLTVDGDPAVDVEVQSDTQLTFTAKPGAIMSRPDLTLSDARGTVTQTNAFLYAPSTNPGFFLFPKNSTSTFAFFYDPTTDTAVSLPNKNTSVNLVGYRGIFADTAGNYWGLDRNSEFGQLDLETQQIANPVAIAQRFTTFAQHQGTVYTVVRQSPVLFGTFDPTTTTFTQISNTLACCQIVGALASNGTNLYIVNGATPGISTINTTTGARGTVFPLAPAGGEIAEMRFLGTTLYAIGGPRGAQNQLLTIDPTTGATTVKHTFPSGTALSALEVFTP